MNGFYPGGKLTKRQALFRILISLCILVASFILVPDAGKLTGSASAPASKYPNYQSHASVPITFTVIDTLHRVKRSEAGTFKRQALIGDEAVSAQTHSYLVSNLSGFSKHISSFCSLFEREFQQACQLVDIPPPANAVS